VVCAGSGDDDDDDDDDDVVTILMPGDILIPAILVHFMLALSK